MSLTGGATIRYRPLEGEPAYLRPDGRPSGRRRPLWQSAPLAVARLVATGCLTLLRLVVSTVLALVVAVLLFIGGPIVVGGHNPTLSDVNGYLSSVLRVSADWMDSGAQLPKGTSGLISETSSTSVARATPSPGSTAGLVATLSQLAPSELREVYQQAVPMLQQYDAFLGDVQTALANDRDLDAFFADVQPWLQQAEDATANPQ